MAEERLFSDFPPISTGEWEAAIREDLKGADYEKRLVWKTSEGFKVKPYYRIEDIAGQGLPESLPGQFPYLRGNRSDGNQWEVRCDLEVTDIKQANQKALYFLNRGVTSLGFSIPERIMKEMKSRNTLLPQLLKDIFIDCIELNFKVGVHAWDLAEMLTGEARTRDIDPAKLNGTIAFDPLSNLAATGNFYFENESDLKFARDLVENGKRLLPEFRFIEINASIFGNTGAWITQELGFGLAMGSEYLNQLTSMGLKTDEIACSFQFVFSAGSDYFMEIAKLRAAHLLWAKIVEAWNPGGMESCRMRIHSITTLWNQALYDSYVNMLRGTTAAMSAILGGADVISIRPFDQTFRRSGEFSDRIALNTQLILKDEALLDKVADPAAGSWYIESLTLAIAEQSWNVFLDIENKGGYFECLKNGYIQDQTGAAATNRLQNISTRRESLLGTNQFPNPAEKVIDLLQPEVYYRRESAGNTLVKPIPFLRAAVGFEALRLKTEKHTSRPKVFLLTYGMLAIRIARANFSTNFFAPAGFEIIDNPGFESPGEGVKAAVANDADIVVICSSDEEYATIAPEIAEQLAGVLLSNGRKPVIVVTGAPPCMEELKSKGISHFINVRSDVLETLKTYQEELGIQ